MFRTLPLLAPRQLLVLVVPLLLLIPLTWLALRHDERATEREFAAMLNAQADRVDALVRSVAEGDLDAIDKGSATVSALGDYVHLSSEGRLIEPHAVLPRELAQPGECAVRSLDRAALQRALRDPVGLSETCPVLRGRDGTMLAPFALVQDDANVPRLRAWFELYGDMLHDNERDALILEVSRHRQARDVRAIVSMLQSADRAITAVEAPFREEAFRSMFDARAKRQTLKTSRAVLSLTQLRDGSFAGIAVHPLSLTRPAASALLQVPRGITFQVVEGDAPASAPGTSFLALTKELGVRFAIDRKLAERDGARLTHLFRLWTVGLAVGLALFVMFLIVDASKRRRLAELRTDYASALAHELRTPTATLLLLSEALEQGMEKPSERLEIAATLKGEVQRLKGTLDRMLSLRRLSEERPRVVKQRSDVRAMIQELQTQYRACSRRGSAQNIELDLSECTAYIDRELFATALENLVDNARKYSPTNEIVNIQLRRCPDAESFFEVCVRDRGPGVEEEDRERIFLAFERGSRGKLSEATEGVGIGLALVHLFATLHGGSVSVRPRDGGGSTFVLRFAKGKMEESDV
jgi:signal transduction histidine kinase